MAQINKRECVSSRVHICATEYGQLITTYMCANLSEEVQVVINYQYSVAKMCTWEECAH